MKETIRGIKGGTVTIEDSYGHHAIPKGYFRFTIRNVDGIVLSETISVEQLSKFLLKHTEVHLDDYITEEEFDRLGKALKEPLEL